MIGNKYEEHQFNEDRQWLFKEISTKYVKRGNFVLSNGQQSEYYIDIKSAYTDLDFLTKANELLYVELARGFMNDPKKQCHSIGGLEAGAIPILTSLSLTYGMPYFWIRKAQKEYGLTEMNLIGTARKPIVIVEDVLNSGAGINRVANEVGVSNIIGVLCVVNRYQFGDRVTLMDKKNWANNIVDVRALFKLEDFIGPDGR